jgi:hypothetical protein
MKSYLVSAFFVSMILLAIGLFAYGAMSMIAARECRKCVVQECRK